MQKLMAPIVHQAVETAVAAVSAAKDAEIKSLKENLKRATHQLNDLEQ